VLPDASRSPLVLVAALAAALVAGCGGNDEDGYRDGLNEAHQSFAAELREGGAVLETAARAKSAAQYGQGAEQLQSALERFKDRLDALDPPEHAKDEEDEVRSAVDEFSDSIARLNAAVQSKDASAIAPQQSRVRLEGQQVDTAIDDLKESVE
jgi:uncharacterized protein YukE